jgi:hypothetical protein
MKINICLLSELYIAGLNDARECKREVGRIRYGINKLEVSRIVNGSRKVTS